MKKRVEMRKMVKKFSLKPEMVAWCIFLLVILAIHLIGLSHQEFNGDEAAPMLLIDRMWDFIRLKDIRFLAYPFLFYSDPYRAFISGTLLHIFGPNRVLLRLPAIFESLGVLWVMRLFFQKAKLPLWLIYFSLAVYSFSGIVINDRSAGGDSLMRLLFLIAVYLVVQAVEHNDAEKFLHAVAVWTVAMLTMLDSIVLLPILLWTFINKKLYKKRQVLIAVCGVGLFLATYFAVWLYLPYKTFQDGLQQHFINRGLFYYLIRAGEGVGTAPGNSIDALLHYTSLPLVVSLIATAIAQFTLKRHLVLRAINISIWVFVLALSHTSFHVIMFFPVLFTQAVLLAGEYLKQFKKSAVLVAVLFTIVLAGNIYVLFRNYAFVFSPGKNCVVKSIQSIELDKSVKRIYSMHQQTPLKPPCPQPIVQ